MLKSAPRPSGSATLCERRSTTEEEDLEIDDSVTGVPDNIFMPADDDIQQSDRESLHDKPIAETRVHTDTAVGWLVVAASFVNCFIVGVMFIAFSMLYVEFDSYFETTKAVSGWIGSLFLATGNICGIIFSVFVNRYGCRSVVVVGGLTWFVGFTASAFAPSIGFLYFTYGIVAGMGFNMVTLSSFIIVQRHFKIRRAFAAAISASGISVGCLVSGPLLRVLIDEYGWRGTLLMMGGIALHNCVFGALYRPPASTGEPQQPTKVDSTVGATLRRLGRDLSDLSLFSNVAFSLLCCGTLLMNTGLTAFFQHTPSQARYVGIEQYSLLPMINGIATTVARIIGGLVGNLACVDRLLQYGVCIVTAGVLTSLLGQLVSFVTLAVVGSAIAFCAGMFLTIQSTVLSDVVGVENISRAQAFILVFTGIGALISVPLTGFIFDLTGNYNIPFLVGGVIEAVGGFLVIGAVVIRRNRHTTD